MRYAVKSSLFQVFIWKTKYLADREHFQLEWREMGKVKQYQRILGANLIHLISCLLWGGEYQGGSRLACADEGCDCVVGIPVWASDSWSQLSDEWNRKMKNLRLVAVQKGPSPSTGLSSEGTQGWFLGLT